MELVTSQEIPRQAVKFLLGCYVAAFIFQISSIDTTPLHSKDLMHTYGTIKFGELNNCLAAALDLSCTV
jgi:hypothetical protein